MHALAYGLQHLYVYCGCATVVTIIFEFFVAGNSVCSLLSCEIEGSMSCDAGHNRPGIEGEYRWISIDIIVVKDFRVFQRRKNGPRQVRCERVFVRA